MKTKVVCFISVLLISANSMAAADDSYVQSSHQTISDDLVRLADTIDRIFGEPRATDQVNRTSLRLAGFYDWTGRGDDNKGTEFRLNLRLPILEREFDTPLTQTDKASVDDRIEQRSNWHLRTEPGVRVQSRTSVFEKARATKSLFTPNFVHNFSQEFTWASDTQWEENTLIESDHALNENLLFRWLTQGDWQITDLHFFSFHGPSLIQKLGELSAISYNAILMSQVQNSIWFADTYTLSVKYRCAVYSNWAFFELTPALLFQKEQNFKGMTNLEGRIEFLFGAL